VATSSKWLKPTFGVRIVAIGEPDFSGNGGSAIERFGAEFVQVQIAQNLGDQIRPVVDESRCRFVHLPYESHYDSDLRRMTMRVRIGAAAFDGRAGFFGFRMAAASASPAAKARIGGCTRRLGLQHRRCDRRQKFARLMQTIVERGGKGRTSVGL
jgi:hypothetical protein